MLGLQDGGYCDAGLLTENVSYLTIDLEQGAKLKKKEVYLVYFCRYTFLAACGLRFHAEQF